MKALFYDHKHIARKQLGRWYLEAGGEDFEEAWNPRDLLALILHQHDYDLCFMRWPEFDNQIPAFVDLVHEVMAFTEWQPVLYNTRTNLVTTAIQHLGKEDAERLFYINGYLHLEERMKSRFREITQLAKYGPTQRPEALT